MEGFWNLYFAYRERFKFAIHISDYKKGWKVHVFRRNVRLMNLGGKDREVEDAGDQEIVFVHEEDSKKAFEEAERKLSKWIRDCLQSQGV